jgi:signal transduction histidine kinase
LAILTVVLRTAERNRTEWVAHTRDVARIARQSYNLAVNRETAIRGYLLTRNAALLDPERRSVAPLAAKLDTLESKVRVPAQRERAARIRAALAAWEGDYARPALASAPAAGSLDPLAGKERFDALRQEFERFLIDEDALYRDGVRDAARLATIATVVTMAALLLVAAVLVRLQRQLARSTNELLEHQEQLEQQATELETQALDLEERTNELTESNRELEAFAYTVAHDLRSPLRSINAFTRIVLEEGGSTIGPEHREHLGRVLRGTLRMGQLIDGLLALARVRRDDVRLEPVDLTELARRIGADLTLAEPGRQAEIRVGEGLRADGDPRLLEVVLRNLMENAWKFSRDRAMAVIEVGRAPDSGAFYVRDNGAGFAPADAERLFAPFTRLHDGARFEGTGIGLATVRRIVERHGGVAWAEGTPDRGATVYFTLSNP